VISAIAEKDEPVVFMLWGNDTRRKARLIKGTKHPVIDQVFASRPFSKANDLHGAGRTIDWARSS